MIQNNDSVTVIKCIQATFYTAKKIEEGDEVGRKGKSNPINIRRILTAIHTDEQVQKIKDLAFVAKPVEVRDQRSNIDLQNIIICIY